MDSEGILKRVEELLTLAVPDAALNDDDTGERVGEMFQGAMQLARLVYGMNSPQEEAMMMAHKSLRVRNGPSMQIEVQPIVVGTLRAMRGDVRGGLVGTVERKGAGLALGDFLALAKEAIDEGTDESKNVAAVLAAALFEDTVRQLGASKARVVGRPGLQEVLTALKAAKVLEGASYTITQGYLKFRNDALHADWSKIGRPAVESCIGFAEGLLRDHFS